jgi:hypothetical protein
MHVTLAEGNILDGKKRALNVCVWISTTGTFFTSAAAGPAEGSTTLVAVGKSNRSTAEELQGSKNDTRNS